MMYLNKILWHSLRLVLKSVNNKIIKLIETTCVCLFVQLGFFHGVFLIFSDVLGVLIIDNYGFLCNCCWQGLLMLTCDYSSVMKSRIISACMCKTMTNVCI